MQRRRARLRAGPAALAALLAVTSPATAQLVLTGELGVARYSDDPFGRGDLAVAAPSLLYSGGPLRFQATGALARLENGKLGGGGAGTAALRLWGHRGVEAELSADAGSVRFKDYDPARYLGGSARLAYRRADLMGALVVQRGQTWLGTAERPIWSAQARLTRERGAFSTSFALTGHSYRSLLPVFVIGLPEARLERLHAGDAELGVRWWPGRMELGLTGVGRIGDRESRGLGGMVDAAYWLDERLAITASAGRQLEDLLRGVRRTRFVTLSLRISSSPRWRPIAPRREERGVLRAVRTADGVTLRVSMPAARSLELSGDLTGWTPMPFTSRGNGEWELALGTAASGTTRVQWRVDGGEWTAPAGLPARPGDFESTVGELLIP